MNADTNPFARSADTRWSAAEWTRRMFFRYYAIKLERIAPNHTIFTPDRIWWYASFAFQSHLAMAFVPVMFIPLLILVDVSGHDGAATAWLGRQGNLVSYVWVLFLIAIYVWSRTIIGSYRIIPGLLEHWRPSVEKRPVRSFQVTIAILWLLLFAEMVHLNPGILMSRSG